MLESRKDEVEADFLDLHATGAPGEGRYRCADCGYGITIHDDLPACPMCGGTVWEASTWTLVGERRVELDTLLL